MDGQTVVDKGTQADIQTDMVEKERSKFTILKSSLGFPSSAFLFLLATHVTAEERCVFSVHIFTYILVNNLLQENPKKKKKCQTHHNTDNAFENFVGVPQKRWLGEDSKYGANLIFLQLIPEENGFLVVEESKKLVRGDRRRRAMAADVWEREKRRKKSGIFSPNFPPAASSLAELERICLTGVRLNSRC